MIYIKSSDIDHSTSIVHFILFLLIFACYRFPIECYYDTEKAKDISLDV
jgi:hypothetical protein